MSPGRQSQGTPASFETEPASYRHWKLAIDGRVARLALDVDEHGALLDGVVLKRNSYDLGVDVELRDVVQRLRFEHPDVAVVVVESALPEVFCAGANISVLARSSHALKVNFCKLTNETRLEIEDATRAGQTWIAALRGTASGGGYELALACDQIWLVDDRRTAVSLPEVPLLAVLPGTGGLTRLVDKRRVRRDIADVFATLVEGVRGRRALEWRLVDHTASPSEFDADLEAEIARLIASAPPPEAGVVLEKLAPEVGGGRLRYRHVEVLLVPEARRADIVVGAPGAGGDKLAFALRCARELDDALLRLRFHYAELGLWVIRTRGDAESVHEMDRALGDGSWLARETRALWARTLKRLENSARSVFAVLDDGSCFSGTYLELALAADRQVMLDDPEGGLSICPGRANRGWYAMANGLTRLETRFFGDADALVRANGVDGPLPADEALALGLVTSAPDRLDFDDELRIALEERASFSPDALTGMEASLRFVGPETLETKIFGRLSAWQNWVFGRPNATGPDGGLLRYGDAERPKFDWRRT